LRAFGKVLGRVILALLLLAGVAWVVDPGEPVDTDIAFDESALPGDLDAWLADSEAHISDIVPGTEKRIVWAGGPGEHTAVAVVYLHGFSGTSEEMRPLPDRVAAALGANLFFTRYAGHGRDGAALAGAQAGDWLEDTAEALAVGRAIGDEVLVVATSTGGTLAAIAATDARLSRAVKGIVFLSPNFGVTKQGSWILSAPLARYWAPLVAGREVVITPVNAAHERFATTRYPLAAAFRMAALVDHANGLDYSGVSTPALFAYGETDSLVSPAATRAIAARWGGPVELMPVTLGPGDDPFGHMLAGDIRSPGQTETLVAAILDWERRL
jgi:esterase/lipase